MGLNKICHVAFASVVIFMADASDRGFRVEPEEIISDEKLSLSSMPKSRTKRAITINLTPTEITDIVDSHNTFRRAEFAANMEELTWNTVLAEMAQEWAEGCLFEHGNPTHPDAPSGDIGQNLFAGGGSVAPVMTGVVKAWHDEIQYYTYATHECSHKCGHYTQVVWAKTTEVGCGYAQCPTRHIVVCNYTPAGNYNGERPYLEGHPCTQCASGKQWCNDGLCAAGCSAVGTGCECNGLCQNCGTLDQATCSCSCVDGWRSPDCSVECMDPSEHCGNGWYLGWCVPERPYVLEGCPAYCGLCVADPNRRLDCPVLTPGTTPVTTTPVTTPACTDWSAWDTSGCEECGGCGTRVQTRTCVSGVETNRINCEAKYCINGTHPTLFSWQQWSRRQNKMVTKYRIRKCCYDYRWNPPKRFWRKKNCASRGIQGWRYP